MTAAAPLPARMRGVRVARWGGPEVLELRDDLPLPEAGPGQLLVRVRAAGVNFMDVLTRQGRYANSRTYPVALPCTLGMEGAGEVVAAAPDVPDAPAIGTRVAWCTAWGSWAEYAAIPAALAATVPDAIPDELAAAAMFQGCTAHYLVEDVARLRAGDTCLVHAAAGAIGQLVVQMARQRGTTVFATASSEAKRAVATAAGAQHVLAYDDGRFAEAVRAATAGRGVDVVFDAVGRSTLRDSFRATRTRGLVVNYGAVSGAITDLDPLELGEAGSLFLTRPRLADHLGDRATVQRRADAVFDALARGALRIAIAQRHTLADVGQGLDRLALREQVGKAVVLV